MGFVFDTVALTFTTLASYSSSGDISLSGHGFMHVSRSSICLRVSRATAIATSISSLTNSSCRLG